MKTKIINIFYSLIFIGAILALCYFSPTWIILGIIVMLLIISVLSNLFLISKHIENGKKA